MHNTVKTVKVEIVWRKTTIKGRNPRKYQYITGTKEKVAANKTKK